tara:strand:+ start:2212 stop:3582 length:1371 start_codon:yes stop_codon:yes gene_type:complete
MATINTGATKFGTPGASNTDFHTRRLFDFSDRVSELSPDESPFFVYLSQVGKVPTSDSQFRFLEDRTKVSITDRSFLLKGAVTLVAAGSDDTLIFDNTTEDDGVDWLLPGMVVAIGDIDGNSVPTTANVRINTVDNTSSATQTTCTVTAISNPGGTILELANNSKCTVIGTSFEEGSGAPDVWSEEVENDYGYTQIFKTAVEMTNTARATVYRGYADEWSRLWNLKLREHKVDIERAMLFGQRGSANGIQYTDGIVGSTIYNGLSNVVNDGSQLSYNSGAPYYKSNEVSQWTYDDLLSDFEVIFDPARGGGSAKLALASLPVISFFNKLGHTGAGTTGFVGVSAGTASEDNPFRYNFSQSQGAFGHQVMKVQTIHGDLSLVKEPLFRGFASGFCMLIDLDHVSYRPLVGNGVNRDTHIQTNIQGADEDLRKDLILTEAGLEVSLPETHALINLEGV